MKMFNGGSIDSFISATAFVWAALIILIMIGAVYFFKKKNKKKSFSEKIFLALYSCNIFILLLEISLYYIMGINDCLIKTIFCRTYFIIGFAICLLIILYFISYILELNKKEFKYIYLYMIIILFVFLVLCSIFLPYEIVMDISNQYYILSGTLNSLYNYFAIFSNLILLIFVLMYHSKISKTFIYLVLFIFSIYIINFILERVVGYNVKDSIFVYSLLVLSLFSTTANQDKKMLDDLNEAKIMSERLKIERDIISNKFFSAIRNIFNDIILNSDYIILNNEIIDDDLKENNVSISNSYYKLSNFLDNVMFLLKMQNNEVEMSTNKFGIDTLIGDIDKYILPIINLHKVTLNFNYSNDTNNIYYCDYNKILKLLINLIFDAIGDSEDREINLDINESRINEFNYELTFVITGGVNERKNLFNFELSNLVNNEINIDESLLCFLSAKSYSQLLNGVLSINNDNNSTSYIFKLNLKKS